MKIYVSENSYHRLSNFVKGCRLIKNREKLGKKEKRKKKKNRGWFSQFPKFPNTQIAYMYVM